MKITFIKPNPLVLVHLEHVHASLYHTFSVLPWQYTVLMYTVRCAELSSSLSPDNHLFFLPILKTVAFSRDHARYEGGIY